jgi:hypothetical protein
MENIDINKVESKLYEKIHSVLLKNINDVYSRSPKPQEPDFVAILTCYFTKDLYDILKGFFPNYNFGITSIYCHQKPNVNFGGNCVELGDLLFIYRYIDKNKEETYNSLLTQAKVTKNLSNVKSQDRKQFELYATWPKFTYSKAGCLNGKSRDIYVKEPTNGAQFLLFDNSPVSAKKYPGVFPIGFSKVISGIFQYRVYPDFTKDLIKFFVFNNGRKFEAKKDIQKDCTNWSQMIWDLICICKNELSRRRNIGLENFNRLNDYGDVYRQKSDLETPSLFQKTTNNIAQERGGEDGAPSIICIEVEAKE